MRDHQFRTVSLLLFAIAIANFGCRAIGRIGESRQSIAARRLSRQGIKAMHDGKWSVAEKLLSNALEVSGSDDRAHRGLAESLWQRNEREAAIKHMEQAVRLSAGDPNLVQRLGRMYLDVGRVAEANQQSKAALQAERSSAEIWALRGDCLRTTGKLEEALAAYHRALALRPDFSNVQMHAAEIYREQGRYDRLLATLDSLEEGLGGLEISGQAEVLRGVAMRQLGQPQEARRCFARAATKNPDSADPHLQIASLCLEQGDLQQARNCVEVAAQLDPIAVRDGQWVEQIENHHGRLIGDLK